MLGIGIVGLPNVGKSTLFNAITSLSIKAANYPFCTVEPNVGEIEYKDLRLKILSEISNSHEVLFAKIKFVDIAGLVKGASEGNGLGNLFLSHIREVGAICHVVRCFEDEEIIHVEESIDPLRDIEIINTELALSDLEIASRAYEKHKKTNNKDLLKVLEKVIKHLNNSKLLNSLILDEKEIDLIKPYQFLTIKPMILIMNVKKEEIDGNHLTKKVEEYSNENNLPFIILSSQKELELSLSNEDGDIINLVKQCYKMLNLINFFTSGPKETRAWTIKKDCYAPEAAAAIHTDMQNRFIKAEVIAYNDFINFKEKVKEKGLLRSEGKKYVVKDGDIIDFKFGR